ncbi:MAG TPA: GDP-mannose 4,6-dehydratase, partial [Chthoniobacteraceae bacterium]|nr:GDP-mannose 4,6-dehydratase [Chthoniobacteraceae bacterium]
GNLAPRRDFTYVTDTADGFVRAATAEGVAGEAINLGSGKSVSIAELLQTILRMIGKPVKVTGDPARVRPAKSEVDNLVADNRKAAALLGWRPRTGMEEGLGRTIEWVARHPGLFKPECYAV